MTNEELLLKTTEEYLPGTILLSAFSGQRFTVPATPKFRIDHDGDVRGVFSENPVIYRQRSDKWAEIISSPKPLITELELTNNFPIY